MDGNLYNKKYKYTNKIKRTGAATVVRSRSVNKKEYHVQ